MKKRYVFTKGYKKCKTCKSKFVNVKSEFFYGEYKKKQDCLNCIDKELKDLFDEILSPPSYHEVI